MRGEGIPRRKGGGDICISVITHGSGIGEVIVQREHGGIIMVTAFEACREEWGKGLRSVV